MKKLQLLSIIAAFVCTSVMAQSPDGFKYQSVVRDANGLILVDQSISLRMTIHSGSAGGVTVYSESHSISTNKFGLVSLDLGSVNPLAFSVINWSASSYFLEVELDPAGGTSYTSMGTSQFMSVPYAAHATSAGDITVANDYDSTNELNQTLQVNSGNLELTDNGGTLMVAIDDDTTNEFNQTFQVNGSDLEIIDNGGALTVPLSDIRDSIWIQNGDTIYSNSSVGWMGLGTASPQFSVDLISGMDNTHRAAFRLESTNSSNTNGNFYYASFFDAISTDGSNTAILAQNISSSSGINYGVVANAHNSTGTNMGGNLWANGGTGSSNYGLLLTSQGVTAGSNYGLYSRAFESSVLNLAIFGLANSTGTNNVGVDGEAYTTNTNSNYGVFGYAANASTNYAGYFQGDVTVTGNLSVTGSISKGSGTFKIDHPLDPENKYLVHSFVEAEDMMNVYNGNVVTDANGLVTVELPDYFETVNKDFKYQLTVIGVFAQAIVKEKVKRNQFVIQTDQPGVEVSWQVTGVRADPYAENNRIVPVVDKKDKGTYLHPEVYNQPETLSETYKNDAWRRDRDKTEAPSPQSTKR